MATFDEEYPSTKRVMLYSLLPVTTLYQCAYGKISPSTPFGMLARLRRVGSLKGRVDKGPWAELSINPSKTRASTSTRPFTMKTFQTHRSKTKMRKLADEVKPMATHVCDDDPPGDDDLRCCCQEAGPQEAKEERRGESSGDAKEAMSQVKTRMGAVSSSTWRALVRPRGRHPRHQ